MDVKEFAKMNAAIMLRIANILFFLCVLVTVFLGRDTSEFRSFINIISGALFTLVAVALWDIIFADWYQHREQRRRFEAIMKQKDF